MARKACLVCGREYDWIVVKACPGCSAPPGATEKPEPPKAPHEGGEATASRLLLTTLETVPGFHVVDVKGLVVGIGHPTAQVMSLTTKGRSDSAMDAAEQSLRSNAIDAGANAVVGIRHSAYASGSSNGSVGVQLLGTAVVLEPSGP